MDERRRIGCQAPGDLGVRCLLSTECDLGEACLKHPPHESELLERDARRAGWKLVVVVLLWVAVSMLLRSSSG